MAIFGIYVRFLGCKSPKKYHQHQKLRQNWLIHAYSTTHPKKQCRYPSAKKPPKQMKHGPVTVFIVNSNGFYRHLTIKPSKTFPPEKKKNESVHKNPVACCPCVNSLFTVINLKRSKDHQPSRGSETLESTHSSPERVERLIIPGTLKLTTSSPLKG